MYQEHRERITANGLPPHPTPPANANKNSQDDITSSFFLGSGLATNKPNGFSGHRTFIPNQNSKKYHSYNAINSNKQMGLVLIAPTSKRTVRKLW